MHSNITNLVTLSVIKYLNLNIKDVLILFERIHINHRDIDCIDFSKEFNFDCNTDKILDRRRYINSIDNKLRLILKNNNYYLFIPQSKDPTLQLLMSNKNCLGINFIEEGLAYYNHSNNHINLKKKIDLFFLRLSWCFRIYGNEMIRKNQNHNYFVVNSNALIGYPNVINVQNYFNNVFVQKNHFLTKNSKVIIFDSLVEYNLMTLELFLQKFAKIMSYVHSFKEVFVKFHPNQSNLIRKEVCTLLELNSIDFQVLDNEVVLEKVIHDVRCEFIGYVSSLLYYNTIVGNPTTTCLSEKDINHLNPDLSKLFTSIKKIQEK